MTGSVMGGRRERKDEDKKERSEEGEGKEQMI
jgi:hypothetical protein